jgi:hypothetical protein
MIRLTYSISFGLLGIPTTQKSSCYDVPVEAVEAVEAVLLALHLAPSSRKIVRRQQ